jgi:ribosomal peptide maturation radical SAM protein 1
MPTLSARFPCFQLGLLKPTLERAGFPVQSFSLYMYFGSHIGWRLHEVLSEVWPSMVGEWIWSRAAFGDFADEDAYHARYAESFRTLCETAGCTLDDLRRVRNVATAEFLDYCVESIDWGRFGLVGFTVLFQQQLASIALARALKKRYPSLPVIFGGGTLEDDIAHEILRNCPDVDYVHCGDADETFPEMVRRLYAGESMRGLPGLLWRDGESIAYAGRAQNHLDMNTTPIPDFDEYFLAREQGGYADDPAAEEPMIPIETARGCWWGEKSHCTFCGLNRAGMEFRAKDVENVIAMLEALSERYGFLGFNAIDNIIDPGYVEKLFGALAEAHTDLQVHYEIKANVRRDQLARMRRGGLFSVQPGVESFSTHVLKLMKKGTTGMRNLELVKWCTYFGINNLYNILVGFHGETREDYQAQCELIAKIPHLQPPYAIARARPDRGSPMFTAPAEHGIVSMEPEACYAFLFPPDKFDLRRVSYYFVHSLQNALSPEELQPIFSLVADWQDRWASRERATLSYRKAWDAIEVTDRRLDEERSYRYRGREARLYEYCADARGRSQIDERLGGGEWIVSALDDFLGKDLMVLLDGRYLSLALPENPHIGFERSLAGEEKAPSPTAKEPSPLRVV